MPIQVRIRNQTLAAHQVKVQKITINPILHLNQPQKLQLPVTLTWGGILIQVRMVAVMMKMTRMEKKERNHWTRTSLLIQGRPNMAAAQMMTLNLLSRKTITTLPMTS